MATLEKCKRQDMMTTNAFYCFARRSKITQLEYKVDSCLENSTFLAGEQKTAADILLFHGSVHESISETLNCGSTTDFECMFQNSWCCVETGLPREREVHSPEQVNHEKIAI